MRISRLLWLLPLWISCLCSQFTGSGQEMFVDHPSRFVTKFSFQLLSGGVVIIRAALDNRTDTLNFILDTGSGGISLDSTTVSILGVQRTPSEKTIRGIAGIRQVDFAYNHSLNFPGLRVDSLDFHINDYSLLSGVYGIRVDGIAGYSLLSRYIFKVNYEKLEMELWTPGDIRYPRGGQVLTPAFSGLPMQYLEIEDATKRVGRFYLDTGAGLCLLLSRDFAEDSAVFSSRRRMFVTIAEGLGGKTEMQLSVIKSMQFGNYRFRNVPTYVFQDDYNVTQYPFLGGLVGNDLMRRFNLVLNYPARQIHILPNNFFRESFDYAYTGLNLFAEESGIYITDVVPNSPADRAGLKNYDLVVSVANDLSGNLQTFKTLLQESGGKVKMIVSRDGQLIETAIEVISIKKKGRRM